MLNFIKRLLFGIPASERQHISPELDFCMVNRGVLTRREHFWLTKKRMSKLKEFYWQYGEVASINSIMDDYTVEFYTLFRGVRLEDIPTECAGVTVQLKMFRNRW